MGALGFGLLLLAVLAVLAGVWRYGGLPCPWWLSPLLENPYVDRVAGASVLLERAAIAPGMRVLDAGCGPGRLTLPAARRVGSSGSVFALDLQPRMLAMLARRVREAGLANVHIVRARLGEGALPADRFDVALLVTVLGEVPLRLTALREIHRSLRPGGLLSLTEVLPDPHYQPLGRVRALAREAGFREQRLVSGWLSYTLNLERPPAPSDRRTHGGGTPPPGPSRSTTDWRPPCSSPRAFG
jgi:SAM-dependent methyltransferase